MSTIATTLILCCRIVIAVRYASSLFVKISGFWPGVTPYLFMYSRIADESIIPGRSLFANTSGRSIIPVAKITCLARTFQSRCRVCCIVLLNEWGFVVSSNVR